MEHIHLSLNQGTTAVYHEFRLRERAETMRLLGGRQGGVVLPCPIDLKSDNSLALGYEAGHALGRTYSLSSLPPDEVLAQALAALLRVYRVLTHRGGVTPSDILLKTSGVKEVEQARRYEVARRLERNRKVRRQVLQQRQPTCEGGGLAPALHYGFGSILPERMPVDVHHPTLISEIAEGEKVTYTILDDFAVLCSTCHRVARMLDSTGDMEQLRRQIRFKHMTEQY